MALTSRSPWPRGLELRHALAAEAERPAGLGAGGIVSRTRPLRVPTGTSRPRRASSRVSGSSRSRSAPLRVNVLSGRTLDDDDDVAATRAALPVSLILVPVSAPGGMVISSRLPSTSTSRVVPWKASSRVSSAVASCAWPVGPACGGGLPTDRPSMPIPARMSSKPMPPVGRVPAAGRLARRPAGAPRPRRRRPGRSRRTRRVAARPELVADVAAGRAPRRRTGERARRPPRRPGPG